MFLLALLGCLINKDLYEERRRELDFESGQTEGETGVAEDSDDSAESDDSGPLDEDQDGYFAGDDCDDAEAEIHPGATEFCDGIDQDCDDAVDEDAADAGTWFEDSDDDGWGDPNRSTVACDQGEGLVALGQDCDDASDSVYPGAVETLDGTDEDCSGEADDLLADRDLATIEGPATYGRFGEALAWGDLDEDGTLDLLVGAPGREGSADTPSIYSVSDPTMSSPTLLLEGLPGTRLGAALLAWEGGFVVGAPHEDVGTVNRGGAVYLEQGTTTTTRWELEIPVATLGSALAAGDPDGDGIRDILMSAPPDSSVYLVSALEGDGSADDLASWTCRGSTPQDHVGTSVAFADLNGDGREDVILGAPDDDAGAADAGAVYLFTWLPDDCTMSDAWSTILGTFAQDRLGYAVEARADENRDASPELAVGVPGRDTVTGDEGAVITFANLHAGSLDYRNADITLDGTEAGARLGTTITGSDSTRWFGAPNASKAFLSESTATSSDELAVVLGDAGFELGLGLALEDEVALGAPATSSEAGAVHLLPE